MPVPGPREEPELRGHRGGERKTGLGRSAQDALHNPRAVRTPQASEKKGDRWTSISACALWVEGWEQGWARALRMSCLFFLLDVINPALYFTTTWCQQIGRQMNRPWFCR